MSITRDDGYVVFHCDDCPETFEPTEDDFQAAYALARAEGWRAVKAGAEWEHKCPSCMEDARR